MPPPPYMSYMRIPETPRAPGPQTPWDVVYIAPTGTVYHNKYGCSGALTPMSRVEAVGRGRRGCFKCASA